MNAKMKSCFTPHVMMHSAFGLGLGLLLAALIPVLGNAWLGLLVAGGAMLADAMRKE